MEGGDNTVFVEILEARQTFRTQFSVTFICLGSVCNMMLSILLYPAIMEQMLNAM